VLNSSRADGQLPKRRRARFIIRTATMVAAVLAVVAPTSACNAIVAGQPSAAPSAAPPAAPTGAAPSGGGGALPIQTAQSRASEMISPATVFVQIDWNAQVVLNDGSVIPVTWSMGCTGFVVNPEGYIVTAGHCVDDGREGAQHDAVLNVVQKVVDSGRWSAAEGKAILNEVDLGQYPLTVKGTLADSRPDRDVHVSVGGGKAQSNGDVGKTGLSARVLDFRPSSAGDVALLKVEASNLPVATLAPKDSMQVGQPVLAVGYPLDLAANAKSTEIALTNRSGVINSLDTQGEHGSGGLYYETSTTLNQGMSGGPVINLDGGVVGLASWASTTNTSQNYFIVPSLVINEMLAGKVTNTPGRVDPLYRKGLDDYYAGYYTDAIADFDQTLSIMPNLQPAIDKKSDAAQRRQQFGDQPKPQAAPADQHSIPSLLIIAGEALGALLVLVGGALMWRRHRRRVHGGRHATGSLPSADASPMPSSPARPATGSFPRANAMGGARSTRNWSAVGQGVLNDTHGGANQPSGMTAPISSVATMTTGRACPGCGSPHLPGDVFCSRCGTRIDRMP
jgi:serine protease Do